MTTLFLVSQGTQVVADNKRRWVDTHWFRGSRYLRIGWQWIKTALVRGWAFYTKLVLNGGPEKEPAIASLKQAAQSAANRIHLNRYDHSASFCRSIRDGLREI